MITILLLLGALAASGGAFLWTSHRLRALAGASESEVRERATSIARADDELAAKLLDAIVNSAEPVLDLIRRWQAGRGSLLLSATPGRLAHAWKRVEVAAVVRRDVQEELDARRSSLRLQWAAAQALIVLIAVSTAFVVNHHTEPATIQVSAQN